MIKIIMVGVVAILDRLMNRGYHMALVVGAGTVALSMRANGTTGNSKELAERSLTMLASMSENSKSGSERAEEYTLSKSQQESKGEFGKMMSS